jgi:hypothetical protein
VTDALEEAARVVGRVGGAAVGPSAHAIRSRLKMDHVAAETAFDEPFERALGILAIVERGDDCVHDESLK